MCRGWGIRVDVFFVVVGGGDRRWTMDPSFHPFQSALDVVGVVALVAFAAAVAELVVAVVSNDEIVRCLPLVPPPRLLLRRACQAQGRPRRSLECAALQCATRVRATADTAPPLRAPLALLLPPWWFEWSSHTVRTLLRCRPRVRVHPTSSVRVVVGLFFLLSPLT